MEEHEHTPECLLKDPVIARLFKKYNCVHQERRNQYEMENDLNLRREALSQSELESDLGMRIKIGSLDLGIENLDDYICKIDFDTETLMRIKNIEFDSKKLTGKSEKIQIIIYLIDTIITIREIVYLHCIINFIENQKVDLSLENREELYFFYGDRPNTGKYIGTDIEEVISLDETTQKTVRKKQKPRNVFLLDYKYKDLNVRKEINYYYIVLQVVILVLLKKDYYLQSMVMLLDI